MKSRTIIRKTFLSIMALVMVAITFTTTTYAWFKINSSATVTGFDFQVTGGEGFLVSIDGTENSYTNDLSSKKIVQAIILSYQKDIPEDERRYEYVNGEIKETDKYSGQVLDEKELAEVISKNIQLLPRTSANGVDIYDQWNSKASVSKGSFLEFSVYFKAASHTAEDNRAYDIYLNYEDKLQDDGSTISKTSISSKVTEVSLAATMRTYDGILYRGDKINVYTSNALRFSAQDVASNNSIIYEYSDDAEHEFGSYATDYNKVLWNLGDYNAYDYEACKNLTEDQVKAREEYFKDLSDEKKEELEKLYNHTNNAMFTYYSSLKNYATSNFEPLLFEDRLRSYRDLSKAPAITTVVTGGEAKLVTFRFWLEGWDADCFDGLAESINVKLTFTSVKKTADEEALG